MRYLPIIGLEVHVRLKTASKLFCSCPTVEETTAPNAAICPVCTGQPGALPSLNAEAVRLGVRTGLALHCHIPDTSHFDRKNYFYPDLPKGYQISQYDHPVAEGGYIDLEIPEHPEPVRRMIRLGITRAHLEEDAAKNIHDTKTQQTLVDYNRAGVALLEIVSEPDLRAPIEAKVYLQELQAILRAIGASEADMEKGYMRCDANISLLPVDEENHPLQPEFNPKIEIKNLNSFRAVERALFYEIERQRDLLEKGQIPPSATRGWDEHTGSTVEQRLKETSADYRFFPEPDLPPLDLVAVRTQETPRIPELPSQTRLRLKQEWGFGEADVRFLVSNEGWAQYADNVMSELQGWLTSLRTDEKDRTDAAMPEQASAMAKLAGGWLSSKLQGILLAKNLTLAASRISPENFAEFLTLIQKGTVNSANALKLLTLMVETGSDPSHLLEEHNLGQSDNPAEMQEIVARLIQENPKQVAEVKAGKMAVVKWFVGCIMKVSEGRMNPQAAEEEVKRQLGV